jgi:hypothetical protein
MNKTIKTGQQITGFWYNKNFYPIAGTVKEIVRKENKATAIILTTTNDQDVITWVQSVEVA